MRLIGVLQSQNDARRFTYYLKRQGIHVTCEPCLEMNTEQMTYQCWVHDEDQIEKAETAFLQFKENPSDPAFQGGNEEIAEEAKPQPEPLVEPVRQAATPFTSFIIALCALIFVLSSLQEYSLFREGFTQKDFLLTPVEAALLFDLPPPIAQLEKIIEEHQIPPDQKVEELPKDVQLQLDAVQIMPFWKGAYDWVVLKIKGEDTALAEGPLFVRIRQGEIWRLFSPALLHGGFLHILFNMIWVWILCRPIEQRIGIFRLMILTLAVGVVSNVLQYLMSGPFFLGYSGIVMGLAAFTWMREKIAPWEGYPLQRSVMFFLVLFIGGIFLLQTVSFLVDVLTSKHFEPNIANTAHIAGAVIGALLARFSFFMARVKV